MKNILMYLINIHPSSKLKAISKGGKRQVEGKRTKYPVMIKVTEL